MIKTFISFDIEAQYTPVIRKKLQHVQFISMFPNINKFSEIMDISTDDLKNIIGYKFIQLLRRKSSVERSHSIDYIKQELDSIIYSLKEQSVIFSNDSDEAFLNRITT
ncbi:hypothetical protein H4219_006318, partial [Mycoemilia scoparia]